MSTKTNLTDQEQKALHEVISLTMTNCLLQTQGIDVAIPYLQGAPGAGKTASFYAEVEKTDGEIISTHFALKMLEELGGIPQFSTCVVDGEKRTATEWSFPDIMKSLFLASDKAKTKQLGGVLTTVKSNGRVIAALTNGVKKNIKCPDGCELEAVKGDGKERIVVWMLDDMHLCGPVHMAMLYEILTERKLREYVLPNNVALVLCGNTSQKAGAKVTFSAIVNRCSMMPVKTDFKNWKNEFALDYGIHPAIISYLSNESYRQYFHEEEEVDTPWASPRSWTRLSSLMLALEGEINGKKLPVDDLSYIVSSHVGKTAGSNFIQYYKIFTNFNMKEIFKNYKNFKIPNSATEQYALSYAIITEFCGISPKKRKEKDYCKKLAHFIQEYRNAKANVSEIGMMMLKELSQIERSTKKPVLKEAMKELIKLDATLIHKTAQEIIEYGK